MNIEKAIQKAFDMLNTCKDLKTDFSDENFNLSGTYDTHKLELIFKMYVPPMYHIFSGATVQISCTCKIDNLTMFGNDLQKDEMLSIGLLIEKYARKHKETSRANIRTLFGCYFED